MNGEIKFRGRRIDNNKWAYGGLIQADDYCIIDQHNELYVERDYNFRGDTHFFHMCDKNTVGQFTGLYDKNGKEIYEGDVLREVGSLRKVEVVCDAPQFCYADNDFGYRFLNLPQNFIVIGNIHDNPELLKAGAK